MVKAKKINYLIEKHLKRPLRNTLLNRSPLFYFIVLFYILFNVSLFYAAIFITNLIFDSETSHLISKPFLIALLFLPLSLGTLILLLTGKLIKDRFIKSSGLLRFRLIFWFVLLTLLPSFFYIWTIDQLFKRGLDFFFEDKALDSLELSLKNLENQKEEYIKRTLNFSDNFIETYQKILNSQSPNFFNHKPNPIDKITKQGKENGTDNNINDTTQPIETKLGDKEITFCLVFVGEEYKTYKNPTQKKNISKNLIKDIQSLVDTKQQKSFYDLKKNYSATIKSFNFTINGLSNQNYYLATIILPPKKFQDDIKFTLKTLKSVSEINLFKDTVQNLLIFLYFYLYFPVLSMGLLLFFILSKKITDPLTQLNIASKKISQDNFNFKIKIGGKDEIRELVKSFRFMTREIIHNRDAIKRASKIEAWKSVAVKLAHELKNPLTPIKLAKDQIDKEISKYDFDFYSKIFPYLNIIEEEISRIKDLILDFSKYSKEIEIKKEKIHAFSFIEKLKTVLMPYQDIQVEYQNSIDKNIFLMIDQKSIRQVVLNLIQNAYDSIKNEVVQPQLKLLSYPSPDNEKGIIIAVEDNGVGVPEKIKNRIFEPYFTSKKNGTGLGLSICNQILDRHQGRLQFESQSNRTIFEIILPIYV